MQILGRHSSTMYTIRYRKCDLTVAWLKVLLRLVQVRIAEYQMPGVYNMADYLTGHDSRLVTRSTFLRFVVQI
jgi:hypothetical protein